ncbi:hypothetical protein PMAYCL1PPCAC_13060, partial [Pristionchus mayeri]
NFSSQSLHFLLILMHFIFFFVTSCRRLHVLLHFGLILSCDLLCQLHFQSDVCLTANLDSLDVVLHHLPR